jgi:hypothetical protein
MPPLRHTMGLRRSRSVRPSIRRAKPLRAAGRHMSVSRGCGSRGCR